MSCASFQHNLGQAIDMLIIGYADDKRISIA